MGMTAFELFGVLKLDASEFNSGLSKAKDTAASAGGKLAGAVGTGLATAAKVGVAAIGAATTAATAFGTKAVQVGSAFDQAMGGVAATLGQTVEDLDAEIGEVDTAYGHFSGTLREFAMYMGQNTTFSATEAAAALNYMALAGYNTQESMEMLPSVLSMAAAGGMDLAMASDAVTDIQSALGLSFERTGDMVNEFAKAASTGNTSVEQLGEAFLRIGGLARELNGGMVTLADGTQAEVDGVQELEIAFTAMANAGIKGAEAGTHMRNILLKLSSPSEDGADSLQNLGVAVFDTEGKMRSLADIFSDLNIALNQDATKGFKNFYDELALVDAEVLKKNYTKDKWQDRINYFGISLVDAEGNLRDFQEVFKEVQDTMGEGLSQEQKLKVISDVFNTRDTASAEALMNAIGSDWDDIGEAILQADGAADAMSKTKLNNLAGDITLFKSAMETAYITLNDKLSPTLREFTQFGTEAVQDITNAFASGGLEKGMAAVGKALSKGLNMIIKEAPKLVKAGTNLMKALGKGFMDNMPIVVDAAVQIVGIMSEAIIDAIPAIADAGLQIVETLLSTFDDNFDSIIDTVGSLFTRLTGVFQSHGPQIAALAGSILQKLSVALIENIPMIAKFATSLITGFADFVSNNIGSITATAVAIVGALASALADNLPTLMTAAAQIITSIVTAIAEALPQLVPMALEIIMAFYDGLIQNLPLLIEGAIEIITALAQGFLDNIPLIVEAAVQLITALVQAFTENLPLILDGAVQLITALVQGITENLPLIIDGAVRIVTALVETITSNISTIIDAAIQIVNALVQGITENLPLILDGAIQIVMAVVQGITENLPALLDGAVQMVSALVQGLVENLPLIIDSAIQLIMALVQGILENLPKIIEAAIQIITALVQGLVNAIPTLVEAIPQIIVAIVTTLMDNLPQIIQAGFDLFVALIQNLPAIIVAIVEAIPQIIQGIVTAFVDAWPQIKESGQQIFESFKKGFLNFGNAIVEAVQNIWSAIKGAFSALFGEAVSIGKDIISNVISGITGMASEVASAVGDAISGAWEWGKDMATGFADGVKNTAGKIGDAAKDAADKVKGFLGFSEPEEGPLSNFHTYAPDMIKLFIEGVKANERNLQEAVGNAFDFEDIIKAPVKDLGVTGSGENGAKSGANYYTINVNQPVSTPADMLREIRTEAQYGLIIGEALA